MTRASIDGMETFHERRTSRAFDVDRRRQRPARGACA
jgi:hypothetical protein